MTGCSSGIGRAICETVANSSGYRLAATARDPSSLSYLDDHPGAKVLKLSLDVNEDLSVVAALELHWRGLAGWMLSSTTPAMVSSTTSELSEAVVSGIRLPVHSSHICQIEHT